MKYLVNQLPDSKEKCPNSKRSRINNNTVFMCDYDNKECNLDHESRIYKPYCRWLKEIYGI